jgi:phosphomannomutase/phosphoglucomutase
MVPEVNNRKVAVTYKITKRIPAHIFRGYDIRGIMDKELNPDVYYTFGRAYATWIGRQRIIDCAVGHDNRITSKKYTKAFIAGLNDGGINTYDLGYSLSQIVYFSAYEYKTKGYAMITASHNAREFNGLKLGTGYSETMLSDEVLAFRDLCLSGKFIQSKEKGKNKKVHIFDSYLRTILKNFKLKKNWKVVVDASNTTSGLFYPEILHEAGCTVIEQNCNLDGNFPLGVPDPTEREVLERLREGVLKYGADLGFAYDADGDRMAVVDENGQVLWMDAIVALFAADVLEFQPGADIVFNNLCSKVVKETIVKKGGQPIMWITGHSFIKAKIKELNSPFGGELSGHIFFNDNFFGHDDAANASLRLLAYLERKKLTLGEAVGLLPRYVTSAEIKLGLADKIKFDFVKNVLSKDLKKIFKQADYNYLDGVRVDTKTAMTTIRASQNGPYITIKFEAKTKKEYERLREHLRLMLEKHPEIDWQQGVNTTALQANN